MKHLNNQILPKDGEIQAKDSSSDIRGRMRFNSTSNIWEYTNDNGVIWFPFTPVPSGGSNGDVLMKNSNTDYDAGWVSIGGFSALICHVIGTGGDDTTAEMGNILKPFETIGAAILVAKDYEGAMIEVYQGSYIINDTNCPFGLMYPESHYSFYFHRNTFITYDGTYGFYIGDSDTDGDIFGYGQFLITSDTFSNSYGCSFYAQPTQEFTTRSREFNFMSLTHGIEDTDNTTKTIIIGSSDSHIVTFNVLDKILGRHGDVVTVDIDGRVIFNGGIIQSTSLEHKTIVVDDATLFKLSNTEIINYGKYDNILRNATILMELGYGSNKNEYVFSNSNLHFIESDAGFKIINITTQDTMSNTLFDNVRLKGRADISLGFGGDSIYSNFNMNIKFINTLSHLNIGGSGDITNTLSIGNGFIIDQNI